MDPTNNLFYVIGRRGTFVVLGLFFTMCGCAAERHETSMPGHWYLLRAGDTPSTVATKADLTVQELLRVNGCGPKDFIPGKRIWLPDAVRG